MKYALGFLFVVSIFLTLSPRIVEAADCPVMYGGGKIDCTQVQPTPTTGSQPIATPTEKPKTQTVKPTPSTTLEPTATPKPQPTSKPESKQTKGGLPVHEPTKAKTTPATGPEAFSLIGLIPAAAAGFYLRRKTK